MIDFGGDRDTAYLATLHIGLDFVIYIHAEP
jgi:hypothetical protein